MTMKTIAAAVLAVMLYAGGANAFRGGMMMKGGGGGPFGGGFMDPGLMLPALLHGVGLTADQKTKVRNILESHHAKFRALFQDLHAANQALADKLFVTGPVHSEDFNDQLQKVAQIRTQLMQEGLAVALEVRNVLTPEQLAKAVTLRQRLESLRTEMRQLLGEPSEMLPEGGD